MKYKRLLEASAASKKSRCHFSYAFYPRSLQIFSKLSFCQCPAEEESHFPDGEDKRVGMLDRWQWVGGDRAGKTASDEILLNIFLLF